MKTWIFQGNPTKFNVDDYLLENQFIWWSIRQEHYAKDISIGDEVYIWRSDGGNKSSGGVIARSEVVSLPQEYTNDDESLKYWYEDVNGSYLAVELEVLEVEVTNGLNRLEFREHEVLSELLILRLRQNTNYLLGEEQGSHLRQLWYARVPPTQQTANNRFRLVESLDELKINMKQFMKDVKTVEKLDKQISSFQQWYYIHEEKLLAPSKFIGYQDMKGHMYIDKVAIAWTDGRATVNHLKRWFELSDNKNLRENINKQLNGRLQKGAKINVLKSEVDKVNMQYLEEGVESKKQLENKFHKAMIEVSKNAKEIGYNPTRFTQMVLTEGGYAVAKKLINSRVLSDGFNTLWELNRLDLTVEAVVLRQEFKALFTDEERVYARERLKEVGYEVLKENVLPPLEPSNRSREYEKYDEELLRKVVYEYLFNARTPRWLDENVLEIDDVKSNGFESMNILHYLGLRATYKGIFVDSNLNDSLDLLNEQGEQYNKIVRLLQSNEEELKREKELDDNVSKDIEAEEVEEGLRNEGDMKYYYGKRYERDSKNRAEAIKHHGLSCVACGFNFEEVYGERGKDFIEVHHLQPLSTLEEAVEINPDTDLVPLCANCHRMVHRRKDAVLSIEELKELILEHKK